MDFSQNCPNLDTGCLRFQDKCFDGTCRAEGTCPDPATDTCTVTEEGVVATTERCPDGSCRELGECGAANGCEPDVPFRCGNKRCVGVADDCPPTNFCPEIDVDCNGEICKSAGVRCPDGTCTTSRTACPPENTLANVEVCNGDNVMLCANGQCVGSSDECPAVATCQLFINDAGELVSETRCPDGSCRRDEADCPEGSVCPDGFVMCNNGACASAASECRCSAGDGVCLVEGREDEGGLENGCPLSSPVRCLQGICATSLDECPSDEDNNIGHEANGCPVDTPLRCTSDQSCVADQADCPANNGCPQATPFRCGDGLCVGSPLSCSGEVSCPAATPVRCGDGSCSASSLDCLLLNGCPVAAPFRCTDGSCVVSSPSCTNVPACGQDKPNRCFDGSCVADLSFCPAVRPCPADAPTLCLQDLVCRENQEACDDAAVVGSTGDPSCPVTSPTRCSTGECVPSGSDCSADLRVPCAAGQIRCGDAVCADSAEECQQRLDRCDADGVCACPEETDILCIDGTCQPDLLLCPAVPACPFDTPVRCPDFTCVEVGGVCSTDEIPVPSLFDGCREGEVFCPVGCFNATEGCPPINFDELCTQLLVFSLKPAPIEVTVNSFDDVTTGLTAADGTFSGEVVFPASSIISLEDRLRPVSTRISSVADSILRGSFFTLNAGAENEQQLAFSDVLISPVVAVEVIDGGDPGFIETLAKNVFIELPVRRQCDVESDPDQDKFAKCLATLDGGNGAWTCIDTNLAEVQPNVFRGSFDTLIANAQNVFAVAEIELIDPIFPDDEEPPPEEDLDAGDEGVDGGVVSGSILAASAVLVGMSYVTWRLQRYRTKYRKWKAEREAVDAVPLAEGDDKAQLVVNPMFLAQQQLMQRRLAEMEGGFTSAQEVAEGNGGHTTGRTDLASTT